MYVCVCVCVCVYRCVYVMNESADIRSNFYWRTHTNTLTHTSEWEEKLLLCQNYALVVFVVLLGMCVCVCVCVCVCMCVCADVCV